MMNTISRRRIKTAIAAALAATLMTGSAVSTAGTRASARVVVDLVTGEARGALAQRNTDDNANEDIGCRIVTTGAHTPQTSVECTAVDANGENLACSTDSASFAMVARTLSSFGYLVFRADADGQCTFMQTRVGSPYLP